MDAWDRGMLWAEMRRRVPAGIEEHKHGTNVMPRRDRQKLIDPLLEASCILLPEQIMQKNAHRVHSHGLRPGQFSVDRNRIEGRLLPHLQLVNSRLGNVIASH